MIAKHSITIAGHRTSISIEERFWTLLCAIARREGVSVAALVARVDRQRPKTANLSSALRLFVLAEVEAGFSLSPETG